MLLPASSSFVTGVIKERARASTLPPRLSFFRPAALAGGREEGEMEEGGGEAEKNSGARRREGRPRWRCPSLRVCSFLCDEFSFGPVLSYGLERAHRKG